MSFCGRQHFGRRLENETDFYIRLAFSGISKDDLQEGMAKLKNWIDTRSK